MRWRTVVFEIVPAVLLVAWPTFVWIAHQVPKNRPVKTEMYLDTPNLLRIYGQAAKDPAAMFAAADAIDREGYSDKAMRLLEAAERLMLAGSRGESAPVPATVGEAIRFEQDNHSSRFKLRELVFKDLVEATIVPRASGEPPRVDLVNQSRRSIRDFVVYLDLGPTQRDNIPLECRGDTARPPSGEPIEWRPKETLRIACPPLYPVPAHLLQSALEGAEKKRFHPVPLRVMFSDAPIWIETNGGAKYPEEWLRRPKARPIEAPSLQPLPCEVAGTCRDVRWIWDAYIGTTYFRSLTLFLQAMMTGLLTCAVARRIFKGEAQLRPARRWITIAAIFIIVVFVFARGGTYVGLLMLPLAGLAYVGWVMGFWIGVWAFRERAESA